MMCVLSLMVQYLMQFNDPLVCFLYWLSLLRLNYNIEILIDFFLFVFNKKTITCELHPTNEEFNHYLYNSYC